MYAIGMRWMGATWMRRKPLSFPCRCSLAVPATYIEHIILFLLPAVTEGEHIGRVGGIP